MTLQHFQLGSEPFGAAYEALLHTVAEFSSLFSMVVRDDLGLTEEAKQLLGELNAMGNSQVRASCWPGTCLLGNEASVSTTPVTAKAVEVLARASDRLYRWRQPELPEDLAFLRSDGSTVLGTIAHEEDAWLELSYDEYLVVVASCGAFLDLEPREWKRA